MIVGLAKHQKGDFIMLGLSRKNIARLMVGKPILASPDGHQLPNGLLILIVFAETEKDMWNSLKAQGVVIDQTDCPIDPRLGID